MGVQESDKDAQNIETNGLDSSTMLSEEKQLRKRMRNIMNDMQIAMIEQALQNELDMQRKAASIQLWADKLSLHGSEISSSQLKNRLNNRKAKLARAAVKDIRVPSWGDNAFTDKQGGSGTDPVSDSPESPADDFFDPNLLLPKGLNGKFAATETRRVFLLVRDVCIKQVAHGLEATSGLCCGRYLP